MTTHASETTTARAPGTVPALVGDPVIAQVRRRMTRFLSAHGGRCTHRQWIAELSLTKKTIADQLTVEMVRKTKTHYVVNAALRRGEAVASSGVVGQEVSDAT